jgi:hypothetical protein
MCFEYIQANGEIIIGINELFCRGKDEGSNTMCDYTVCISIVFGFYSANIPQKKFSNPAALRMHVQRTHGPVSSGNVRKGK